MGKSVYCTLEVAVQDFCAGKFLILVDAQERENEGDLIVAAEHISGDKINRMLLEARGMLHLATTEDHLDRLGVGLIEPHNADHATPRFGLPFDALAGITTGVSAADRAESIRQTLDPDTSSQDIVIPGHVLQGHTEGSVELARRAGLFPAAVMSEVMASDGSMAKGQQLVDFAIRFDCHIVDIEQIHQAVLHA
jgi:3,4-dihydroxy-2-butanone 4-phosphate synthase